MVLHAGQYERSVLIRCLWLLPTQATNIPNVIESQAYKEIDLSLDRPAFVDSNSYVVNRHKTHFGAVSGASVLICPWIHRHD